MSTVIVASAAGANPNARKEQQRISENSLSAQAVRMAITDASMVVAVG